MNSGGRFSWLNYIIVKINFDWGETFVNGFTITHFKDTENVDSTSKGKKVRHEKCFNQLKGRTY